MVLRCLRAELMKCRRAPVWLAFLVLPLFPAVLGTFNYLGNLEVLDAGWYSLWTQHTLFASMFFLPAQFGVFCAWQWRLEHADHNWNAALTAPVPVRALYLGKLLLDVGVSALAMALIGLLFLLSGRLAGISAPLPPELPGWLGFGALGCTAVCAVQLYLSLAIRAFAPPVAIALVGGIFGLLLTSQGFGAAFPYSLLCLGMRANNPQMPLPLLSGGLRVLPSALLSAGRTAALPPGCRHRVKHTPACHSTRGYVLPPIEKVLSTAGGFIDILLCHPIQSSLEQMTAAAFMEGMKTMAAVM